MCQIQVDTHSKTRVRILLGITVLIAQRQKWLVTIQIVGRWVTCVAYDIKPTVDAIRHAQCARVLQ